MTLKLVCLRAHTHTYTHTYTYTDKHARTRPYIHLNIINDIPTSTHKSVYTFRNMREDLQASMSILRRALKHRQHYKALEH